MSLTVFLALCVLGVDIMIYFFFKLVYGERHRNRPRRSPPHFYSRPAQSKREKMQTSSVYVVPAPKSRLSQAGRVIPMRQPNPAQTRPYNSAPRPMDVRKKA
ncbi:MAG TPA: hypothetical protein VFN26_04995 [Candidatus Acidoferrum sp.]|nr:hypothetical protein [Candidatus Acidoferrum sp.]